MSFLGSAILDILALRLISSDAKFCSYYERISSNYSNYKFLFDSSRQETLPKVKLVSVDSLFNSILLGASNMSSL